MVLFGPVAGGRPADIFRRAAGLQHWVTIVLSVPDNDQLLPYIIMKAPALRGQTWRTDKGALLDRWF